MPLLVFVYAAFTTSVLHPSEYPIDTWQAGKQSIQDKGMGITLASGDQPSYLFYRIPIYQQAASAFFCDISLQKPIPPVIFMYYRKQDHPNEKAGGFLAVNLSPYIRSMENNSIHIDFDDYPLLIHANEIVLSFASPHGNNRITLHHPHLQSYSFSSRLKQIFRALFRRQPLTQGSNNFILSQTVNGHGYLYFLGIAALLSTGFLLLRRFIFRENFTMIFHIAIIIVVTVTIADIRNTKDYFQNAMAAFQLRSNAGSLSEHLGKHESRFRWFGDVVKCIKQELPRGGYYIAKIKDPKTGLSQAIKRAYYYVRPALHTDDATRAAVALLYNVPIDEIDHASEWRLKTVFPSGVHLYVKNK